MFGATWGVVELAKPNLKLVEPLSMTNGVCAARCGSYDKVGGIDGREGIGREKIAGGTSVVDVIKLSTLCTSRPMAAYPARRLSVLAIPFLLFFNSPSPLAADVSAA